MTYPIFTSKELHKYLLNWKASLEQAKSEKNSMNTSPA